MKDTDLSSSLLLSVFFKKMCFLTGVRPADVSMLGCRLGLAGSMFSSLGPWSVVSGPQTCNSDRD